MSFNFFKQFKLKTPAELVKVTRDALLALDSKTVAEVRLLEKALEEVDKNLVAMKHMLLGEGDTEPNPEQVTQLTVEACKDDFLELLVQKLPTLGWDARKDSVNIWCTLLRQNIGGKQLCLELIEQHTELLDFLVSWLIPSLKVLKLSTQIFQELSKMTVCVTLEEASSLTAAEVITHTRMVVVSYETKEIALNCGNMLRECARYPTLAKYMLESASFELFFKYVELPNFDIASDAFSTFKELLTRHEVVVCEYLTKNYTQFFKLYDKLLGSNNYVTRRQSLKLLGEFLLERSNAVIMIKYISEVHNLRIMMNLIKDPSKNIQSSAFHVFKVFVANPNKSPAIVNILFKNRDKLLGFLDNFHIDKEDDQFEEEKELLIKEIEGLQPLSRSDSRIDGY